MSVVVSSATDNVRCHVHQINGGEEEATVVGNSVTVMFEGTGPSADNVATDFRILVENAVLGVFEVQEEFPCSNTAAASIFNATCTVDAGKAIAKAIWGGVEPGMYFFAWL